MTTVEQAIFTSAASVAGQGYRVVASSPGVSAEEKANITTASPSHNSMCDPSSETDALTFYTLRSQRVCVARSCHAGCEQTGRGGQRVLTQAFVLSPDDFAEFQSNPFALLRALDTGGAFITDPARKGTLAPVTVAPQGESDPPRWSAACDLIADTPMAHLLALAMSDERSIIACIAQPSLVLEALLLAIPSNLRSACSFSIGLKFALARRHRFTVTGPLGNDTHRIVRGQKVALVENIAADNLPPGELSPWQEMVADCRHMRRLDDLRKLTRMSFDDTAGDALDRIAHSQVALNHIADASTDDLFDSAMADETDASNNIQNLLDASYTAAARRELLNRFNRAKEDDIRTAWMNLLAIADQDPAFLQLCVTLHDRLVDLEPPPPTCDQPTEDPVPSHASPP